MELGALKNTEVRSARLDLKEYNFQHATGPCGLERELADLGFNSDQGIEIIIMEKNSFEFGQLPTPL